MSQRTDWLPANREGQLAMARDWINILSGKAPPWGVPVADGAELQTLAANAAEALSATQSETFPDSHPPINPDELRKSFFTKRKKDVIEFDFGDSGKTAFFAVQIENGSKKGPWGPLVSALIP
jgi:hypothetical protein